MNFTLPAERAQASSAVLKYDYADSDRSENFGVYYIYLLAYDEATLRACSAPGRRLL